MNIKKVVTGIMASALMACSLSAFTATAAGDFAMTFKKGDLSGDGRINGKDRDLLISYVVGNTTLNNYINAQKAADVNWDNTVDIMDVICMNKYLGGDEYAIHTGDLDHDNVASSDDVNILSRFLLGNKTIDWKDADFDGDGDCDSTDLLILNKYVHLV